MPEAENYEPDDAPLTALQIEQIRMYAASFLPRGKLPLRSDLFRTPLVPREHDFVELLVEQDGVSPLLVGTRGVVVHLNQLGRACEVEFLR